MRGVVILAAWLSLLESLSSASGAAPRKENQDREQRGSFAIYAGQAPWSAAQGVFLIGEKWTPQIFGKVPADVPIGAQGRLIWHVEPGQPVHMIEEFDAAEVPVRPDDLAAGSGEPAILAGRSRQGAAILLRALAPGDERVLALVARWYKQKELTATEWAFLLRVGGYRKILQTTAKVEPESAYELLVDHWEGKRWGAARALLHARGKKLEPLLSARHDAAETGCAPVAKARGAEKPTGLSIARILELGAAFALGKKAEAQKGLKGLLRQAPRLRESLCLGRADALPEHELFLPDRPRVLLLRLPAFIRLLQE